MLQAVLAATLALAAPAGGGYTISGPFTHDNLSIFLVHGKERLAGRKLLTLQEAMAQKKVVVHETGQVNQLAIENVSQDSEVFVQAGDIVKGGQQDRVVRITFVVPPRSGRLPIDAFCVEHGRWSQRGGETVARFSSADAQVASKGLKLAARKSRDQAQVWNEVRQAQDRLAASLGASVQAPVSASSLQLTLEHQEVAKSTDAYLRALSGLPAGKKNVIGYAFAVNGRLNSAEVYASSELFQKLWPKLLKASAVEAIGERAKGPRPAPPAPAAVKEFLSDAERGPAKEEALGQGMRAVTQETEKNVLFETRDRKEKDAWIHRTT